MGRTVSLKGAAAKAFMEAQMGVRAETDERRVDRVLVSLELALKAGTAADRVRARLIVMSLARDGLEKTAERLTAKTTGPSPSPAAPVPPPKLTGARIEALHAAARGGRRWYPHGPQVRVARKMADEGLGEWRPLRGFELAMPLFQAYQDGQKAGLREGSAGISTPAMSGGVQNPHARGTAEKVLWDLGFQDGTAEKEGVL